jgi:hypothetical protein
LRLQFDDRCQHNNLAEMLSRMLFTGHELNITFEDTYIFDHLNTVNNTRESETIFNLLKKCLTLKLNITANT